MSRASVIFALSLVTACGLLAGDGEDKSAKPEPAVEAKTEPKSERDSERDSASTPDASGLASQVAKAREKIENAPPAWPTFQGNNERTGVAPKAGPIDSPKIRWKASVGIQGYLNAPLVVGDTVFVPSSGRLHNKPDPDDGVHALELATGKPKWHASSSLDANGAVYTDGRIIFTSDDAQVRSIDAATGAEGWRVLRKGNVYSVPVVVDDVVVVGDSSGGVAGLGVADGKNRWSLSMPGAIRGGIAADADHVYVVSQGGTVVAIDPSDGSTAWKSRVTRPGFYGGAEAIEGYHAPTIVDGKVIVPFARDTTYDVPALVALSTKTGDPVWTATAAGTSEDFGNLRSSPAVLDGTLVWAEPYSGDIVGAEVATGAMSFRNTVGECLFPQYASPAIAGTRAYVPRHDGWLYAVDMPGGAPKWRVFLGRSGDAGKVDTAPLPRPAERCDWSPSNAPLYSPVAIAGDGTVIAGSGEGWVYAIEG